MNQFAVDVPFEERLENSLLARKKLASVLQCLLAARGQPVGHSILLAALKSTGSTAKDPEMALRITIHNLRRVLKPERDVVSFRNLGYAIRTCYEELNARKARDPSFQRF
jgi:DNA-binding winged helix-turn-helix (wHTH) protein